MNWKLNAAFAACLMVTSAQANFAFELAYGDANFAALNNSSVGTTMTHGSTVKIPLRGANFRVQVWARCLTADAALATGGSAMIAYDWGQAAFVGGASIPLASANGFQHKKVVASTTSAAGSIVNWASGLTTYNSSGGQPESGGNLRTLSSVFRGAATGNLTNPRTLGLSAQFGVFGDTGSPGRWLKFELGSRLQLFDVNFTSQMNSGETYGFAQNESGLAAHVYGGTNGPTVHGGSTTFLGGQRTGNEVGTRVNLQAVPEPGSFGALALAALMLIRRRGAK